MRDFDHLSDEDRALIFDYVNQKLKEQKFFLNIGKDDN